MNMYDRHPSTMFRSQDPIFQVHQTSIDIHNSDEPTDNNNKAEKKELPAEDEDQLHPIDKQLLIDIYDNKNNTTGKKGQEHGHDKQHHHAPVNRLLSVTPPPFGSPISDAITPGIL